MKCFGGRVSFKASLFLAATMGPYQDCTNCPFAYLFIKDAHIDQNCAGKLLIMSKMVVLF